MWSKTYSLVALSWILRCTYQILMERNNLKQADLVFPRTNLFLRSPVELLHVFNLTTLRHFLVHRVRWNHRICYLILSFSMQQMADPWFSWRAGLQQQIWFLEFERHLFSPWHILVRKFWHSVHEKKNWKQWVFFYFWWFIRFNCIQIEHFLSFQCWWFI